MLMRRVRGATTLKVVAVVGMISAMSGCALVGWPQPDPAAPSPGRSSPPISPPSAAPTADPERPAPVTGDAPPLGLDVRYVDEDGNFKVLRVRDFPR